MVECLRAILFSLWTSLHLEKYAALQQQFLPLWRVEGDT